MRSEVINAMKALKNDYEKYVNAIGIAIEKCYSDTVEPSNMELMHLYAFIGRIICAQGEKAFVVFLAELLRKQFPDCKGFSPRNMRRMRDYYLAYENSPDLLHKTEALGWTQNVVILESCESNEQRTFYIDLSLEQNLSKIALLKAIEAESFEQTTHGAGEKKDTQTVAEVKIDIVTGGNIRLKETDRIVYRPFLLMCLTSRQGNFMPLDRQAAPGIVEENVLGLCTSSQRAYLISFINLTINFIRKAKLFWMDQCQRWIVEKFTAVDMIPDRNKVIWKPPKIHTNCPA